MPRIVDLSVTIENNMPAHKNMPRPVFLEWMTHESCRAYNQGVPGDAFTTPIEYVGMLNHVGTHVDAFYHLGPDGQTIDEMPLDLFMGQSICFDLTHVPDLGDIDVSDMESEIPSCSPIRDSRRPPPIGWRIVARSFTASKVPRPTGRTSLNFPAIGLKSDQVKRLNVVVPFMPERDQRRDFGSRKGVAQRLTSRRSGLVRRNRSSCNLDYSFRSRCACRLA